MTLAFLFYIDYAPSIFVNKHTKIGRVSILRF